MIKIFIGVFVVASIVANLSWTSVSAQDRPFYGAWGFDVEGQDETTKAGDNFFRFANGSWLDKTTIPADKPSVSLRSQAAARTEVQLHELLEAAAANANHEPKTVEGKVGAYFKAFMDEARIEQLGASPITPALDAVRAATTHEALAGLMGRATSDFEGAIYGITLDVDLKDQTRYAVYITQSGLGLPNREYYLKPDFDAQRKKYQAYVARLLMLASWPEAEARANDIIEFESKIAEASWTKAQDRDLNATYNPLSVSELENIAPGFAWRPFLNGAGLGHIDRIIVAEKSAFPKIAAIYSSTSVKTLQAWQAFHILDNAAFYLSKQFSDAYFEMHDKVLAGQQEQQVRWKRGVHAVSGGDCPSSGTRFDCFGDLGWAVGQLYVSKFFAPTAKAKIQLLVANLTSAYRTRIEKLDWMSEPTKLEAIKKLDTYTVKVGYPDHMRDYSQVVIRDDDAFGNAQRAGAANWAVYLGRLRGPVDRSDWAMTPQTNDAYQGRLRDIVFPAAFLQPPIFDPDADAPINYGAIGAAIGHELTHGFDDEGRKIDAVGTLRDWWAPEDAKRFEARATLLGKQYSGYEPVSGMYINGEQTMGENIADLGGLTLALEAYHASLHGKPAPVVGGFTGDQRVFLGWAQAWRGKARDEIIHRQITRSPYSPPEFRVNGVVRNMDAWYTAFHVRPGDKLYIAPKDRVCIW